MQILNKLIISSLVFLLFSCASEAPKGKTAAEVLYKEAKELVDDERFLLAQEKLNALKSQYPYSVYATPAELLMADILFYQENFVEAAGSYHAFRDLHPKNKRIGYVVWMIAESYYNQLPSTFDRDLSPAVEAIKYYNEYLKKYQSEDKAKEAEEKIADCEKRLRSKDKYIADFYYKVDLFDAARYRYLDIIKLHNDGKLQNYAKMRVVESSFNLSDYPECIKYYQKFKDEVPKNIEKKMKSFERKCSQGILDKETNRGANG